MKHLLPLIFFFISLNCISQKVNIDSLTKIALSRKSTSKITSANVNRDSILKLLPSTKDPASRIKLIYDVILIYGELTPKEAFYYHNKILNITRKNNDKIGEAVIMAELGYIISQNGDYNGGLKMIFDALKIAEKTGNNQALGIVYDNLAVIYTDLDLKRKYLHKALKYSKAGGDDLFVAWELSNLSQTFSKTNMPDSANYYRIKSYEFTVNKNVEPALVTNLLALANLEKNPKKKLEYYRAALKLTYTKMDPGNESIVLMGIAQYYKKQNIIDSSFFYANKAYKLHQNLFFIRKMAPAKLLASLYNGRNADSTLKYLNIYYSVRDSVYNMDKVTQAQSLAFADNERLRTIKQDQADYKAKLRMYVLAFVLLIFLSVALLLWRINRKKHKAFELLQQQKEQTEIQKATAENALNQLKITQSQLIQSEKMASLGELTAGIAHEIQNPLNFVNNFSEVSNELLDEMNDELDKGDIDEAKAIAGDIKQNLEKINFHGKRADGIVKGMLQHSRSSSGIKEPTDINKLADEYLRLAYHGLRAKDKTFNATMKTAYGENIENISIIPQDMGRVILNLITNAFYAVTERKNQAVDGYEPTVTVSTKKKGDEVELCVMDNGNGIPQKVLDKIFQPFFTTKPTGQGTGLGLSLSYDIVKAHRGELEVQTTEGEGSEFIITLPIK